MVVRTARHLIDAGQAKPATVLVHGVPTMYGLLPDRQPDLTVRRADWPRPTGSAMTETASGPTAYDDSPRSPHRRLRCERTAAATRRLQSFGTDLDSFAGEVARRLRAVCAPSARRRLSRIPTGLRRHHGHLAQRGEADRLHRAAVPNTGVRSVPRPRNRSPRRGVPQSHSLQSGVPSDKKIQARTRDRKRRRPRTHASQGRRRRVTGHVASQTPAHEVTAVRVICGQGRCSQFDAPPYRRDPLDRP